MKKEVMEILVCCLVERIIYRKSSRFVYYLIKEIKLKYSFNMIVFLWWNDVKSIANLESISFKEFFINNYIWGAWAYPNQTWINPKAFIIKFLIIICILNFEIIIVLLLKFCKRSGSNIANNLVEYLHKKASLIIISLRAPNEKKINASG